MKILFLDIEVAPTLATVWGLFNQNIALNQIIGNSEVLTWAARWRHKEKIMDGSLLRDGKHAMLRKIHYLLSECDAVVTWNGNGFDLKVLNKEFLLQRFSPPPPFKSIDLLATSRSQFRFTSNKMDYVAKQLGVKCKVKHRGHEMWLDCMSRKPAAFREMLVYNRGDIETLAGIYEKFVPWVKGHPNHGLYEHSSQDTCPNCGSNKLQSRGYQTTRAMIYVRLQCQGCGAWSRRRHGQRYDRKEGLLLQAA